ncbi:molybdopterin-binding protein [Rhizobiaceae bacterium n13]|uniref:Molybdopterin-binding protein n=1 Tax=Ferirhizobium litorale TaxID=2927786 RepID=A0AAE3QBU1_9HYPH|nr:molybdopterin-binding protein [Fererhizobium litorale]MDI7864674.1 molybdopterin-binding protein [Fererhizobium litorale]MDI7922165.1 molybdopterin-binding protein [Fererhizobium litorale]
MRQQGISRRCLLGFATVAGSSLALAGCSNFDFLGDRDNDVREFLSSANGLTYRMQRLLLGNTWLAPEYTEADIRQAQRPNGTTAVGTEEYTRLANDGFSAYRLTVGGLVERPASFSLAELRNMPSRTQITRHDCVEGWSTIAKWAGVPLSAVLDQVRPRPDSRYVVFHCFDNVQSDGAEVQFYGSIDLVDARHPQTILAYTMNDAPLPVANGAPLRVRVERQLGYKMSKFIKSIELVSSLAEIQGGHGGYWEDQGYDWYAGI